MYIRIYVNVHVRINLQNVIFVRGYRFFFIVRTYFELETLRRTGRFRNAQLVCHR